MTATSLVLEADSAAASKPEIREHQLESHTRPQATLGRKQKIPAASMKGSMPGLAPALRMGAAQGHVCGEATPSGRRRRDLEACGEKSSNLSTARDSQMPVAIEAGTELDQDPHPWPHRELTSPVTGLSSSLAFPGQHTTNPGGSWGKGCRSNPKPPRQSTPCQRIRA